MVPKREIVAVADRYASFKLLDRCRSLEIRSPHQPLRLDGALYEPAPPRHPRQIGRPRIKGERLPNLSVVAKDPTTVWKPTKIANWYGSGERMVEIASQTAVWYSTGLFAVAVRWVLIRDPEGKFKTQALLCTDLQADPKQILSWFVMRWQLEVTFQEAEGIWDSRRNVSGRSGNTKDHTGTVGAVLGGHFVCPSPDHTVIGRLSAPGGLVPQDSSDLRRCAGLGTQRVVGQGRADFSRVGCGDRQIKVPRAYVERLTDAVCYAA